MPMAIPFYTTVRLQKTHEPPYSFESDLFGQRTSPNWKRIDPARRMERLPVWRALRIAETGREAMLDGDIAEMGQLMTAAHNSQRDDLGTSCDEVDFSVDAALNLEGCYARGGFGGRTVNLVIKDKAWGFFRFIAGPIQATLWHRCRELDTFLLSPIQSAHTTRQHIFVNGGYTHLDWALT